MFASLPAAIHTLCGRWYHASRKVVKIGPGTADAGGGYRRYSNEVRSPANIFCEHVGGSVWHGRGRCRSVFANWLHVGSFSPLHINLSIWAGPITTPILSCEATQNLTTTIQGHLFHLWRHRIIACKCTLERG